MQHRRWHFLNCKWSFAYPLLKALEWLPITLRIRSKCLPWPQILWELPSTAPSRSYLLSLSPCLVSYRCPVLPTAPETPSSTHSDFKHLSSWPWPCPHSTGFFHHLLYWPFYQEAHPSHAWCWPLAFLGFSSLLGTHHCLKLSYIVIPHIFYISTWKISFLVIETFFIAVPDALSHLDLAQ